MKLLGGIILFCLVSHALATYGLYALVPSSYLSGFAYAPSKYTRPAAYRYTVPVGYKYKAPAHTTFIKYVDPDIYDVPVIHSGIHLSQEINTIYTAAGNSSVTKYDCVVHSLEKEDIV